MRRVVISGMIGNCLEWYDYALYGLLAPVIAKLFFPNADPIISLIETYGTFAVGFIPRPIGGMLFGYIGDKYGRRVALSASILMMAIPTACIGLLPTYSMIGIFAPIALILIRLIQGAAMGGAFSGAMAFVVEHAPDNHRGKAGATSIFSMVIGLLGGSAVSALLSTILTPAQFESFGWRIPFVLGVIAAIVGHYIRHSVDESPKYLEAKENGTLSAKPIREVLTHHLIPVFQAMGIYLIVCVPFYTLAIFMVTFSEKMLDLTKSDSLWINTINMVVLLVIIPISAILSDKYGRKPVLLGTALGFLFLIVPIVMFICKGGFIHALIGQMAFSVLVGMFIAPVPALLVEMFPTSVRYTGMALSYNICVAIFGGTTPIFCTWLIKTIKDNLGLSSIVIHWLGSTNAIFSLYIVVCAVICSSCLMSYRDHSHTPLR